MPQARPFAELMRRLEAGDAEAAAVAFRLYAHRLIALARGRIDGRLRGLLSGSDVAQEVLNSFFRRHAEGSSLFCPMQPGRKPWKGGAGGRQEGNSESSMSQNGSCQQTRKK